MQFSIRKLFLAITCIAILFALSFGLPIKFAFPVLLLISIAVVPPILWVGAINTRGPVQAFIIGCMLAGTPHFVFNIYLFVGFAIAEFDMTDFASDTLEPIFRYSTLGGYAIGLLGGLSGLGSYYLWVQKPLEKKIDSD